jgi:hypothetical protein
MIIKVRDEHRHTPWSGQTVTIIMKYFIKAFDEYYGLEWNGSLHALAFGLKRLILQWKISQHSNKSVVSQ